MKKNKTSKSKRIKNGAKNAKAKKKATKRAKQNSIKIKHRNLMFNHEIERRRKFLESLAQRALEKKQSEETESTDNPPIQINTEQK